MLRLPDNPDGLLRTLGIARLPAGALYGAGRAKPLFTVFVFLFVLSTAGFAYTAALSAGYSIGNFTGGYLADHWGYALAFLVIGLALTVSILLSLTLPVPCPRSSTSSLIPATTERKERKPLRDLKGLGELRAAITPNLALATLIAFYLNVLDDGFAAFFPLFGLSVGLSLTFIGLLKSVKSLTATGLRPFSGTIFRYIHFRALNNVLVVAWALTVFLLPSIISIFRGNFHQLLTAFSRGLIPTCAIMTAILTHMGDQSDVREL